MTLLVQLSGGLDSVATLLLSNEKEKTEAFFVDYGQIPIRQEREAARFVCSRTNIKLTEVKYRGMAMGSDDYIPIRNLVLGAMAAQYASSIGATTVVVGNKTNEYRKDDPWCWRDCTSSFFKLFTELIKECSEENPVVFSMPLIGMSRAEVGKVVDLLGEKYEIKKENCWSCYANQEEPCGICFHCKEGAL